MLPQSGIHALYRLAAMPEIIPALREEIEPIIRAEGYTKASMGKLHILDSFLCEAQRLHSASQSKRLVCQ